MALNGDRLEAVPAFAYGTTPQPFQALATTLLTDKYLLQLALVAILRRHTRCLASLLDGFPDQGSHDKPVILAFDFHGVSGQELTTQDCVRELVLKHGLNKPT